MLCFLEEKKNTRVNAIRVSLDLCFFFSPQVCGGLERWFEKGVWS